MPQTTPRTPEFPNTVFLVHGQDRAAAESLSDFLRHIGLTVMWWEDAAAETANGSTFTLDIVKAGLAHAGAVVVLFTPDEVVELRAELSQDAQRRYQPRPNVLVEAGMILAHAAPKAVIVEAGGLVHRVSDLDGINTIRLNSVAALGALRKRLGSVGCTPSGDDSWMARDFSALFRAVGPLPPRETTRRADPIIPVELRRALTTSDDRSLVLQLQDLLPIDGGYWEFARLNAEPGYPRGVEAAFWVAAANEAGRLIEATQLGMKLS